MSNLPPNRWKTPQLQVAIESEGINHASWIELFFDLVFVTVIAELTHYSSDISCFQRKKLKLTKTKFKIKFRLAKKLIKQKIWI